MLFTFRLSRGFTLIELLVVIAIVGLISTVVLSSVNSARAKGADATIRANLANLRGQAEIYYDTNNNYGTNVGAVWGTDAAGCATANTILSTAAAPSLNAGIVAAESASDVTSTWVARCSVTAGGAAWAVAVPLKTNATRYFCVDSSGAASTTASLTLGSGDANCN